MLILTALVALIQAITELVSKVIEGQAPEVRKALWERHMKETEWAHKLLAKFSDQLEKLIEGEVAKLPTVVPPKP